MLKDNGWQLEKQEGSHQKWAHPERSAKVTVDIQMTISRKER